MLCHRQGKVSGRGLLELSAALGRIQSRRGRAGKHRAPKTKTGGRRAKGKRVEPRGLAHLGQNSHQRYWPSWAITTRYRGNLPSNWRDPETREVHYPSNKHPAPGRCTKAETTRLGRLQGRNPGKGSGPEMASTCEATAAYVTLCMYVHTDHD